MKTIILDAGLLIAIMGLGQAPANHRALEYPSPKIKRGTDGGSKPGFVRLGGWNGHCWRIRAAAAVTAMFQT